MRTTNVHQVGRVGADVAPQRRARLGHQVVEAPAEEFDGLPLQLGLPPLVGFEDGPRARAEGTVVEKDDIGVEEKLLFEVF